MVFILFFAYKTPKPAKSKTRFLFVFCQDAKMSVKSCLRVKEQISRIVFPQL